MKTSADTKHRLCAEIDRRRDELAQLCADSLKVPAENPPGDTTAIADHYAGISGAPASPSSDSSRGPAS